MVLVLKLFTFLKAQNYKPPQKMNFGKVKIISPTENEFRKGQNYKPHKKNENKFCSWKAKHARLHSCGCLPDGGHIVR